MHTSKVRVPLKNIKITILIGRESHVVCGLDLVSAGSALAVRGHEGLRRGNFASFVGPKNVGAACKTALGVTSTEAALPPVSGYTWYLMGRTRVPHSWSDVEDAVHTVSNGMGFCTLNAQYELDRAVQ